MSAQPPGAAYPPRPRPNPARAAESGVPARAAESGVPARAAESGVPVPTDGELDGWLSLPSFEPTEGEHLEEIATYSAAPIRAAAALFLAFQAHRDPVFTWPMHVVRIAAVAVLVAAVVGAIVIR